MTAHHWWSQITHHFPWPALYHPHLHGPGGQQRVWLNWWAERWSLVVVRSCVASTLYVAHPSWRPGQEIKAQQPCPHTPLGQRPPRWMACQPLSTLPVYSTINLEMSGFPHWTTFRFSGAVRERWQLLPALSTTNPWVGVYVWRGGRWGIFTTFVSWRWKDSWPLL